MKNNYVNVMKVNDLNIICEGNMTSCDVDFSLFLLVLFARSKKCILHLREPGFLWEETN